MSAIQELLAAEARAQQLLDECVRQHAIVAGTTERALSQRVFAIAEAMFGVKRYWHKRIVRAGRNTVLPYAANPPDLTIQPDDIVFFDFGPVFGEWEADVGRTVVVGNDPRKLQLAADVARAWDLASDYYRAHPEVTAAALYAHVGELARGFGWDQGHVHCGHVVGRFPHEQELDDDTVYLRADNPLPLRRLGLTGQALRWILEIHFVDPAREFGGFQEALLLEADEV